MSDRQELWQAYDEQGLPIAGKSLTKLDARSGVLHGAAHVWLWRRVDGVVQVLLQKRAVAKLSWGGYLDISAAGHIDVGERPEVAAVRETSEELKLELRAEDLRLLFTHRAHLVAPVSGIIENEVQFVYGAAMTPSWRPQADGDEVDSLMWADLDEYLRALSGDGMVSGLPIVPHGPAYAQSLQRSI